MKTIRVGNNKVVLYRRTCAGNPVGWKVTVNGEVLYRCLNVLSMEEVVAKVRRALV
jgi:hypothetical protein